MNFENLPVPVELPAATRGRQGMPIVRRVEVGRIEPVNEGENRGRPVMEGPTLTPPIGNPQVYGPQPPQPAPIGNFVTPGGRSEGNAIHGEERRHVHQMEPVQPTPSGTLEGSWGVGNVNPFWSPEVRVLAGRTGGGQPSQEAYGRFEPVGAL